MDAATRTEIATDLANAVTAYQQHRDTAATLLRSAADPCRCEELVGCNCGQVPCTCLPGRFLCACTDRDGDCECLGDSDPDTDRADAAIHAQLAVAAAGIAQAMATLLAQSA